jgi:hypothetical protein
MTPLRREFLTLARGHRCHWWLALAAEVREGQSVVT